jgi:hypothetical protein
VHLEQNTLKLARSLLVQNWNKTARACDGNVKAAQLPVAQALRVQLRADVLWKVRRLGSVCFVCCYSVGVTRFVKHRVKHTLGLGYAASY